MKNILIFGGTRFFGKKAVKELIKKGHHITIATRGRKNAPFGDQVSRIIVDRQDGTHSGWKKIREQKWDVVLDNICFTKEDADLAVKKLAGRTNYYFLTSTMSIYEGEQTRFSETDFDPWHYIIDPSKEITYGEGKRQAEAVLFQQQSFKVAALRIPVVLDLDDYTRRLHEHIRKTMEDEPVTFLDPENQISFIKGSEVADVIVWLIENQKTGIYNASADDSIAVKNFVKWIDDATGKETKVHYSTIIKYPAPFSQYKSYLDTAKLKAEGYRLMNLENWLKPLINELYQEMQNETAKEGKM